MAVGTMGMVTGPYFIIPNDMGSAYSEVYSGEMTSEVARLFSRTVAGVIRVASYPSSGNSMLIPRIANASVSQSTVNLSGGTNIPRTSNARTYHSTFNLSEGTDIQRTSNARTYHSTFSLSGGTNKFLKPFNAVWKTLKRTKKKSTLDAKLLQKACDEWDLLAIQKLTEEQNPRDPNVAKAVDVHSTIVQGLGYYIHITLAGLNGASNDKLLIIKGANLLRYLSTSYFPDSVEEGLGKLFDRVQVCWGLLGEKEKNEIEPLGSWADVKKYKEGLKAIEEEENETNYV